MHIFGPVASRRLGLSLGVDLLDECKTCNLNCIYCELGKTKKLSLERKIFVETEIIIDEIKEFLEKNERPDFITLSGNGEPTLALNVGDVIQNIKKITDIKVAVLTNGILLYNKNVRNDLKKADVVLPSLDAGSKDTFTKINRPPRQINFEKVKEGLIKFSQEYKGSIWIEIMLVKGINDNENEIEKIKQIINKMKSVEKIQLNTVVRAGAESYANRVHYQKLLQIKNLLGEKVEIIADYKGKKIKKVYDLKQQLFNIIKLRPVTMEEIQKEIEIDKIEILKIIDELIKENKIKKIKFDKKEFYKGL